MPVSSAANPISKSVGKEGLCHATALNNCNEMEARANICKLMKICK